MNKETLIAADGVIYKDKIYCVCKDYSLLYSIDLYSHDTEVIGAIPGEYFNISLCSKKIINYDKYLVIIPFMGRYIHIYDIEKNEWEQLEIKSDNPPKGKYIEAVVYKDRVIIIGAFDPYIAELNMSDRCVEIKNEYFKKITKNDIFCRSGHYLKGDYLYLALGAANEIMVINLLDWSYKTLKTDNLSDQFSGMAFDGESFILSPRRNSRVVYWNGDKLFDTVEIPIRLESNKCYFEGVYYFDGKYYLQGFNGSKTVIIDLLNNKIDVQDKQFWFMKVIDDKFFVMQIQDGEMIVITEGKTTTYSAKIDIDLIREYWSRCVIEKNFTGCFDEDRVTGIKQLIEVMKKID